MPSFVPSLFARDSGWGLVPSENLYADLDDDGAPDVAIGRLPVRTPADADAVADKIASQDAALAALGETHLAVADNSTETDAPFREDAQRALALLPDGSSVEWADLAQGPAAARAALLAGWQSGVMATHYFGHGGLTEWADEQVLTTDDVAALGHGWKPTALFTWACLSQYYLGVDGPSLNEALLLQPGGGALASFGPAGITPPARQAPLVARVYDELRSPGTSLGEAIRRAKARRWPSSRAPARWSRASTSSATRRCGSTAPHRCRGRRAARIRAPLARPQDTLASRHGRLRRRGGLRAPGRRRAGHGRDDRRRGGAGRRVAMVDLTRGESGSRGTPETRAAEAAEAARVLGAAHRESLGLPDAKLAGCARAQGPHGRGDPPAAPARRPPPALGAAPPRPRGGEPHRLRRLLPRRPAQLPARPRRGLPARASSPTRRR